MKAQLGKQTGIALALLATLLATLFAMGVFSVAQAQTTHSAERSFSTPTVAPSGEVTVTINVMGYTGSGLVEETLPAGFSIGSSTPAPFRTQGVVSLWAFEEGVETITYTVTAPSQPGTYNFMGTFTSGSPAATVDIGGTSGITVAAPTTNGGNGDGNGDGNGEADAESAALNTNKASSATRLTIVGSGSQLGAVGPGDEIVINLAKFGLPASIDEADVTIDDGSHTANPQSVSVSGSNIKLLLGKFDSNLRNDDEANIINSADGMIRITIRDRAGITTPTKAGDYTVKVDADDADDAEGYDLDGDNMMVSIIRSISVSPKSATRGTEITVTGKGFSDGSAGVMAGDVSIGSADVAVGSFTLTVNNNIKVNNVSAFAKGADGTDIQATDGAGDTAAAAANHKINATFTADPESPNPGQDVTITLADTDVTGSSTVSVRFGGGSALDATNTDDDKDTTWKVGVPSSVRRGTIQMSVTVDSADALTKNITIATNPLEVVPSTVVPGQEISVTGTGFTGASTIAAGGVEIGSIAANTEVLLVNNVGSISFDVSVPDGVAAGEAKVEVTDADGRVGEATITVTKAALTLDPVEGLIGSDLTVSGVGFPANDLVLIKYNDNTITTANTDSTGTFSKGIVVPSSGIATGGSYAVTAESQINDVAISASKTHKTPKPTVTLSDAMATAGSSLTVDGANFKGFVQVYRIEIGGQNVTTLPAPATDQWGSFSATVQVPQLSPGRYAVKAIVEDTGGDSATEFLQVVETVEVVSTDPADVFADLGDRLVRVWYLDRATQDWQFYDPDPAFASFNRLTEVTSGQVVTVIITDGEPVEFQGKSLYQGTNPISLD
jgi:uncharacterized protein (DUF2141 family)